MAEISLQQVFEIALEHHRAGNLQKAEEIYRQVLAQYPVHPDALHWLGVIARQTDHLDDSLMLIQGPLLLDWRRRRIENGCLQISQPPDMHRLDLWMRARIHVPSRPDWLFVKLHTHGAPESNQRVLLGGPMVQFHQELARRAKDNPDFHFHYVTARELYNLARAAEAGYPGDVAAALDYELTPASAARSVTWAA